MALAGSQSSRSTRRSHIAFALAVAAAASIAPASFAADVLKANNATDLNLGASWVGGVLPGTGDIATFDSTLTSALTVNLGNAAANNNLSIGGVRLLNPAGDVVITDTTPGVNLTIGTSGIDLTNATQNLSINSAFSLGGDQVWSVGAGRTLSLTRQVQNSAAVTLRGPGTTALDFTAPGAPQDNILNSGTNITLSDGAKLLVSGGSGGATNVQTFGSTALGIGRNVITVDSGAGTVNLNLGTLTTVRGATVVFNAPASGTINASLGASVVAPTGLLQGAGTGPLKGTFATYGLSDYAAIDANGNIVSGTTQNIYTTTAPANNSNTATNWDVIANYNSGTSTTVVYSVRFNTPGVTQWDSRTVWGTGGFLVTPNIGAANITLGGSGSVGAGRDNFESTMVIWQNNTQGHLIINVSLSNPRTGPGNVVFSGIGTTRLNTNATFTGQTFFNGGTTLFANNINLGAVATGAQVNLAGGALIANPTGDSVSLDNAGANLRPINVAPAGGTLGAVTGKILNVNGVVSGSGRLNIGTGQIAGTGAGTANPTAFVGDGTVVLSNANTYTGGTTISAGKLQVTNTTGSATGTGPVFVNGGGTLAGTGIIEGPITVASGGHINPGTPTGTLNVNALTLSAGSVLDFGFGTFSNDVINVLNGSALTLGSNVTLNLFQNGGTSTFAANGTYTLFTGVTNLLGANVAGGNLTNFVVGNPAGAAQYAVTQSGSNLLLTITGGANAGVWNVNGGGSWGVGGNWTGGIPNGPADSAVLGTILTSNATVNLDGDRTLAKLTFNNTAASYTVAQGLSGSLILNAGAQVDAIGNHAISAPIVLGGTSLFSPAAGSTLTLSNSIGGAGTLGTGGAGTIVFTGTNSTPVSVGAGMVLQAGNGGTSGAIGAGDLAVAGTLRFNRSDDVTLSNTRSGTGTIENAGTGKLILLGDGGSLGLSVTGGTAQLGAATAAGTGNVNVGAAGTFDLNGLSPTIGALSGAGIVDNVAAGGAVTLTVSQAANTTFSGILKNTTGTLSLVKAGNGNLTLAGANQLTTDILINGGALIANHSNAFGTGKVLLNSPTGLGFGDGVNIANNIELRQVGASADNFFVNGAATLSGNVTMADPNAGGTQMRLSSGTGTLTLLGNVTAPATFTNSADNTPASPIVMITRGTMIFAGNSVLDSGNIFWFGRSAGNTANITFKDNAQFIGRATGTAANIGGSSSQNTGPISFTVQDNAFINMGRDSVNNRDGISAFDINAGGAATVTTLNLNGGTMALSAFTKSSGTTSIINFNGTQLIQGADNASFLPDFNGTANIMTGGLKIATNFTAGIDEALIGSATDGGITKTGTGTLIIRGASAYTGPTTLTGGQVTFENGPHAIGPVNGTGNVVIDFTTTVTSDGIRASRLQVDGTAQIRQSNPNKGVSKVDTLAILGSTGAWTGKLDITDNTLILTAADPAAQATVIATVTDQINSGKAGGLWNGTGITSSTMTDSTFAAANVLVVVDNGELGATSLRGQTGLDANTTIVAVAHNGDATLDGKVDAFDLNKLAANWQTSGKSWVSGDFTGDGKVDAFDLNTLAANWQFGAAVSLEAALADFPIFGSAVGGAIAAVPEPASLAVLAAGGAALLGRRRRQ